MLDNLKKKLAIVLIISMVFSNAGMSVLASSVEPIVNNAKVEGSVNQTENPTSKYVDFDNIIITTDKGKENIDYKNAIFIDDNPKDLITLYNKNAKQVIRRR